MIKTLILTLILFITLNGSFAASTLKAPPHFSYKKGQAVFVDFTNAVYKITYDYQNKNVSVESTISFYSDVTGYPIFDLVPEPLEITLNGSQVTAKLESDPDNATKLRIIQKKVSKGTYTLKVKHLIAKNVVFDQLGVASAFWLGDLSDRNYLEQYIPSNLEYDHYAKKFLVNFSGFGELKHIIKTNGSVKWTDDKNAEVVFPNYYTCSSVFFHIFPVGLKLPNVKFDYTSIDGRIIPVDIYTSVDINPFIPLTKTLLAELENDYGPFPHEQVLIYGNSLAKGGMEYSGATATGLLSLGHELFHSYNARGVLPSNGNSGWMDEAMSRWRDNGYPLTKDLTIDPPRLAGHSVWKRSTDRKSYTEGSAFLSFIAYKMDEVGINFKEVLKDYFANYMHKSVTTKIFENQIKTITSMDFSEDFKRFIYQGPTTTVTTKKMMMDDPHHPILSEKELRELTRPAAQ